MHFNPRTPVGCDRVAAHRVVIQTISIHAPQWGATTSFYLYGTPEGFQSTHPSGVRLASRQLGETSDLISIHAPQWGATCRQAWKTGRPSDFNPRTPVGCDLPAGVENRPAKRFQSTHPSGVRHGILTWPVTGVRISIHAPQWGAT